MAEEKGYWFSTENGTHIHAEEGESKEAAMSKKFKGFGKNKGQKEEKGLKVESRSMINENQANDPRDLADKMDSEVTDEDIDVTLSDFEWQITDSTTVGQYAEETAQRLGIDKNRVLERMKQDNPNLTEDKKMAEVLEEHYNPQDLDQERSYGPEKYNNAEDALKAVDYYMGQDDEDSIDKFNNASEQLDMLLPFANDKEKEEWMNISQTGTGEEIIDFAKGIIERNKAKKPKNDDDLPF